MTATITDIKISPHANDRVIAFTEPYWIRRPTRTAHITPQHRKHLGNKPHVAVANTLTHEQLHLLLDQLREYQASGDLDNPVVVGFVERRLRR